MRLRLESARCRDYGSNQKSVQFPIGWITEDEMHKGFRHPRQEHVFEGNTGDPKTVASQVSKIRERFHLKQIILVGDRGMLTSARIREDLKPQEGVQWISALKSVGCGYFGTTVCC